MKKGIKLAILAMIGSMSFATAQTPAVVLSDKAGWHKIGERTVDFKKDRDEVMVVGADRFLLFNLKCGKQGSISPASKYIMKVAKNKILLCKPS